MSGLAEALRGLPDDADMIEYNPDEGPRYFCCGHGVSFHVHPSRWPPGSESREGRVHAPDCWYMTIQAALAAHDAAVAAGGLTVGEGGGIWATPEHCVALIPETADSEAYAARIVACVNACTGIADPAALVAAARAVLGDADVSRQTSATMPASTYRNLMNAFTGTGA